MQEYSREEVLTEAKKLAEMLANTKEIERFKKQAVNLQAYEKKEALKIVEDTLAEAEEELDSIPIVNEFKEIQETVNNVLQLVSGTIAREVTNHIIESTGGNLLEGKTG